MSSVKKFIIIVIIFSQPYRLSACENIELSIKYYNLHTKISVEIADSYSKRKKGLMNRKKLASNSGMLFIYDFPQRANFWMKNTSIPLDIAFADRTGRVVRLVSHTIPFDVKLIEGGENIQYVLEINAGMSNEFNLFEGSKLEHPRIGINADQLC